MYNKKQNNAHPWKSKLTDPLHFPKANLVDKNAAWLKLQERLGEGHRNNKAFWYWAVAACLLIALSLTMLIPYRSINHQQNIVSKEKEITAPYQPLIQPAPSNQENKIENIVTVQNRKKEFEYRLPIEFKKVFKKNPEKIFLPDSSLEKVDPIITNVPINIAPKNGTDSPLLSTVVFKEKKKMRVVHINELDEPPQEFAKSSNKKQSIWGSSLINNNQTSSNDNNNYSSIFKIRISSN
ncbi:MAG: hypothetical protein JST58_14800 [Bacteroidetes bacterium]|nr:hypothetical protein [Bacteroidota bacterium]